MAKQRYRPGGFECGGHRRRGLPHFGVAERRDRRRLGIQRRWSDDDTSGAFQCRGSLRWLLPQSGPEKRRDRRRLGLQLLWPRDDSWLGSRMWWPSPVCGFHNLALQSNGTVVAWGYDGYGETTIPGRAPNDVIAIAAGLFHSLALRSDGTALGWGQNGFGEATVPPGEGWESQLSPAAVTSLVWRWRWNQPRRER